MEQHTIFSKKMILVPSFGTTHLESIDKNIGIIEKNIAEVFPDFSVIRSFTSKVVLSRIERESGLKINSISYAIDSMVKAGVETVICQPTHIMSGYEYNNILDNMNIYAKHFKHFEIGSPLLDSVEDYKEVVEVLSNEIHIENEQALVLIGHGTRHSSNSSYITLDYHFKNKGYDNIFVGTIESTPDVYSLTNQLKKAGYSKVILTPLMVVIGDHANNDIAGDESDSWSSIFRQEGFEVKLLLKGIGEYAGIRRIYIRHIWDAIKRLGRKMD